MKGRNISAQLEACTAVAGSSIERVRPVACRRVARSPIPYLGSQ